MLPGQPQAWLLPLAQASFLASSMHMVTCFSQSSAGAISVATVTAASAHTRLLVMAGVTAVLTAQSMQTHLSDGSIPLFAARLFGSRVPRRVVRFLKLMQVGFVAFRQAKQRRVVRFLN